MRMDSEMFGVFGTLLKVIPVFLIVVALAVFVVLMIRRNIKNNPKEHAMGKSVAARVLSKRERKRQDPNISLYDQNLSRVVTYFYYITFETKNFERIELSVTSEVYHALAEDQTGTLTYEGSRYIDFIPGEW